MKKNILKMTLTAMVIVSTGTASGQVLYKVEGNGLKSPSYVFGTHHVAPLSVAEQFGAVEPFDAATQLDSWFQTTGKAGGKTIIPLETAEQQAVLLYDSTPISVQAEALVEMIKEPEKAIEQTKTLSDAYARQDLKAMYELSMKDASHPEFMEAMLDRRNADWLTKLPAIFEQGPTFVAVGALHLAGDKGIIEGLRKAGYTVTPIEKYPILP